MHGLRRTLTRLSFWGRHDARWGRSPRGEGVVCVSDALFLARHDARTVCVSDALFIGEVCIGRGEAAGHQTVTRCPPCRFAAKLNTTLDLRYKTSLSLRPHNPNTTRDTSEPMFNSRDSSPYNDSQQSQTRHNLNFKY